MQRCLFNYLTKIRKIFKCNAYFYFTFFDKAKSSEKTTSEVLLTNVEGDLHGDCKFFLI